MRFLPLIGAQTNQSKPGVYEFRKRYRRRVLSLQDLAPALASQNELDEARSEILFHKLYEVVALEVARQFSVPLEISEDDDRILREIASMAQVSLNDEKFNVSEDDVDRIVWRNAARTSCMTLFDHVANAVENRREQSQSAVPMTISADDWPQRVMSDTWFDRELFSRSSGLFEDEIEIALTCAARAIIEWHLFKAPGMKFRYQGIDLFIIADESGQELHFAEIQSPTVAYMEAEMKREDDGFYYFAAEDGFIMPIGSPLYLEENAGIVTISSGNGEFVAPRVFSLSFRMIGAAPSIGKRGSDISEPLLVLTFSGTGVESFFAVPKGELEEIGEGSYLLQTNVKH